jgi:DNA-binding transcriptional LysR family regulator
MSYLVQLRSFVEVYKAGSISKAAMRLGISQPAMSAHIHSLEAFTGCVLFTRRSHGVVATVDGEELARLVASDLETIELKLSMLRSRTRKSSGTVSFIGPAELMWSKLPYLVKILFNEGIKFKVLTGNRKRIYSCLLDGSCQLVSQLLCRINKNLDMLKLEWKVNSCGSVTHSRQLQRKRGRD